MKKNARDNRPYLPPVKRIELSEDNIRMRFILIAVFLVIAIIAFAVGYSSLVSTGSGWQTVKASPEGVTYSEDFVLTYDFSTAPKNPSALEKMVTAVYNQALEESYRIFSPDSEQEDIFGVAYLNQHPNEKVTVAPALYAALSLTKQYDNRHIFTAPAMGSYDSLFLSTSDVEAALCDPELNPETSEWLDMLAVYVRNPEDIWVELHGENQVTLHVSQRYEAFAQESEIDTFLDFGWMRNAFVVDYLAEALIGNDLTNGFLASYDGFTRNLDTRGQTFTQNLFDREGNDLFLPALLHYSEPMSIVFLRDYPMSEKDRWHYYAYESGRTVTAFLDPASCKSSSSTDTLVAYSGEAGCGEILMQIASVFTAQEFDTTLLINAKNFESIWFAKDTLYHTEEQADLELVTDVVTYTKKLA